MNTIDRYEIITIDGKEYKLKFSVATIIRMEPLLTYKSVLATLGALASEPIRYADLFTFFRFGLMGGGTNESRETVEELFEMVLDEMGFPELQSVVFSALMKSGAIGKIEKN